MRFTRKLFLAVTVLALPLAGRAGTYSFQDTSSIVETLTHGTAYTWGLFGGTFNALETAVGKNGQSITSATLTLTGIYDWTIEPADVVYVNLLNNVSTFDHSYTYNSNPSGNDTNWGTDPFEVGSVPSITIGSSTKPLNNYLPFTPVTVSTAPNDQANSLIVANNGMSGSTINGAPVSASNDTLSYYYNGAWHPNPGTWSDPSDTPVNITIQLTSANISLLTNLLQNDVNTTTDLGLGFGPDCHFYDSGVTLSINTSGPQIYSVPDGGTTLAMLGAALVGLLGFRRWSKRLALA